MMRYYNVTYIAVHYASGKTVRFNDDIYTVSVLNGAIEIIEKSTPEVINVISLSAVTSIDIQRPIEDVTELLLNSCQQSIINVKEDQ